MVTDEQRAAVDSCLRGNDVEGTKALSGLVEEYKAALSQWGGGAVMGFTRWAAFLWAAAKWSEVGGIGIGGMEVRDPPVRLMSIREPIGITSVTVIENLVRVLRAAKSRESAVEASAGPAIENNVDGAEETGQFVFCRKGEIWHLVFESDAVFMKDSKGLRYLAYLLRDPERPVGINELFLAVNPPPKRDYRAALMARASAKKLAEAGLGVSDLGDSQELIDIDAKRACEYRLERDYAAQQERDAAKAAEMKEEIEKIREVLRLAVGLRGRPKTMPSIPKRKRKAITNCIRDAFDRIDKEHESLGRHLRNAVRTGWVCSYKPEKPIPWAL